jgi:hypothetical protein
LAAFFSLLIVAGGLDAVYSQWPDLQVAVASASSSAAVAYPGGVTTAESAAAWRVGSRDAYFVRATRTSSRASRALPLGVGLSDTDIALASSTAGSSSTLLR